MSRSADSDPLDPARSVWVSAHAGSGKTYVLTRRVIRLLLADVEPSRILCLTYTKAAAANMQDRIFGELAAWIALDDRALAERIVSIAGGQPGPEILARARRLFAEAVETPGGLRIQTIHAFCERLLHLFPLEANVPATFAVLDETEAATILARAIDGVLRQALDAEATPLGQALRRIAVDTGLDELMRALQLAMAERDVLRAEAGIRADDAGGSAVRRHLGVDPCESLAGIDRALVEDGIAPARWPGIARFLETLPEAKATDHKLSRGLAAAASFADLTARAAAYRRLFLTKDEAGPLAAVVTKAVRETDPVLAEALDAEKHRVFALLDRRRAVETAERTEALLALADAVAARIRSEKQQRSLLDFDDLIERTGALLRRADAAWILYKLDGGIDHLLVDEAQDTSPAQWRILKDLTADFFAGAGAVSRSRSVFAVGDEKQSIYSFQGADPRQFGEARRHFLKIVGEAGGRFEDLSLHLSWRSSPDILAAVDSVFADPARRRGLTFGDDVGTTHASARGAVPGLVELWPPAIEEAREETFSDEGIDMPVETAPSIRVARRIAGRIAQWLREGARFEDDGRPIGAGDIIVLVRRRNVFFEAVIRALKDAGVPVAGADRLQLAEHIAVMDLLALARVMLLPQDDLSLAAVLTSPLCGLGDDDLIALAPGREGSLWAALGASAAPRHQGVFARLCAWRTLAARSEPFDFFAVVLGRDRGRHDLLARLGPDAAEAIDAFLADALAYARREGGGLRGFVDSVETGARTVKRDMDATADAVRVMTVHAAKGLEARIVFLADTFSHPMAQHEPPVFRLGGEAGDNRPPALVWSRGRKNDPAAVQERREIGREAAWDEYRRLLYVALTRARDRLYIAGYRGSRAPARPVWYTMIEEALRAEAAEGLLREVPAEDGLGDVLQWRKVPAPASLPDLPAAARQAAPAALPDWLRQAVPPEQRPDPPLRPSSLLADAPPEAGGRPLLAAASASRRRGTMIHRLFERLAPLPPARRAAAGRDLLRHWDAGPAAHEWLDEVLAVFALPEGAPLFGPDARAEVPLAGEIILGDGVARALSGRIDRLLVRPDAVWIADFKSGRPAAGGAIPASALAQLAGYRLLLGRIYPGRALRCFIVWTAGPRLEEASEEALAQAQALLAVVREGTP